MPYTIEALFIDRDGTIGGDASVIYPGAFKLYAFSEKAIQLAQQHNLHLFAFTNQPGISKGESSLESFKEELEGFGFEKAYICPHHYTEGCSCRKPNPTMLLEASMSYHLNPQNCIVIGDRWSDMLAAERAHMKAILVKTGAGEEALGKYRDKWKDVKPIYIAEHLLDAIEWLLQNKIQ